MKMCYNFLPIILLVIFGFKGVDVDKNKVAKEVKFENTNDNEIFDELVTSIYNDLETNSYSLPSINCFEKALKGFEKMKNQGVIKKDILTIIDFSLSSSQKRMWIIDMSSHKVLLQTVVSHGKKSGEEFAEKFSNTINSNMSSLGFYKTSEPYDGKHGFSLRLDGMEKGINDNARNRAVVIHGAEYASESLIRKQGRLGRSLGCPAVPLELRTEIINLIKEDSCLFIYYPSQDYFRKSIFLS